MESSAVLFDLDGTLLDTLEDLADSVNAALAAAGRPVHPLAAYKLFVGDGIRSLVERAYPPGMTEGELDAAVSAVRCEYERRWKDKSRAYPGIPELLDALAARGLPMAILSNKPHPFTLKTVEALLPRGRFRAVLGALPGRPLKPDPAGALELARGLGLEPANILYLGDTGTDMQTAVRAGMRPIGALWGFRGRQELDANGAETLLARPEELLSIL